MTAHREATAGRRTARSMCTYRMLGDDEIAVLEENGCRAQDWTAVSVSEDFVPAHLSGVSFYGDVRLGAFDGNVEVSGGFFRHSGIRNAVLRDVTVGDNCLIENIGNHISNYTIGDGCHIANVSLMETTEGATFGEGGMISVLSEAGRGNVMLFRGLTSNLAALMVRLSPDRAAMEALKGMVRDDVFRRAADRGTVGNGARIVNTTEVTNTNVGDLCEISGACRVSDSTIASERGERSYVGTGVILEGSIVADGSAVTDSARVGKCFVGEATRVTGGFTAESSLFFANSFMANGEAAASFCGPFSVSHHKSTLLIGGMFSFYNAGSATNFSNHAYKMGPVHHGVLGRGCKTASSSHILWPATIGAFSVCLGRISNHPDLSALPFSYVIGEGGRTVVVPGRNLVSAGLYRDVAKWPRRDVRMPSCRKSVINHDWLSPVTVHWAEVGRKILVGLRDSMPDGAGTCTHAGCVIHRHALDRGIDLYAMAVDMFIGKALAERPLDIDIDIDSDDTGTGLGGWEDLSGLILPGAVLDGIADGVRSGETGTLERLGDRFLEANAGYGGYLSAFLRGLIRSRHGIDDPTRLDVGDLVERGRAARAAWMEGIRRDALREFDMGDVERDVLDGFLSGLGGDC